MSDAISPIRDPARAAHEIVLELVRSGSVPTADLAAEAFTTLLNHFEAEKEKARSS